MIGESRFEITDSRSVPPCPTAPVPFCPSAPVRRGGAERGGTVCRWSAFSLTEFGIMNHWEGIMARAIWKGKVIAESDAYELVEGNIYFPPDSLKQEYFKESEQTSECPWKGTADYYTVVVDGEENPDAAWFYADPKPAAAQIKNHVAFWQGVTVER